MHVLPASNSSKQIAQVGQFELFELLECSLILSNGKLVPSSKQTNEKNEKT